MKPNNYLSRLVRGLALATLTMLAAHVNAQTAPRCLRGMTARPSRRSSTSCTTTTQGNPNFVPPAERIATFDQDGTLWVEHPMYSQVMYILERVPALVKAKPELAKVAPVLDGA